MSESKPGEVTPFMLAKSGTEHGHQRALFAALKVIKYKLANVPGCAMAIQSVRDCVYMGLGDAIRNELIEELDMMFAIPNGGKRGDSKESAMIAGGILKAEGVRTGVSDTMLPVAKWGYHGLFIEMKKPKGIESEEQIEWGELVRKRGYEYACCYNWIDALVIVLLYLNVATDRFNLEKWIYDWFEWAIDFKYE